MNLYNLKMIAPNHYQMAKFGPDFNVEAVYDLEPKGFSYTCNCPANLRSVVTKPCKHKRMMPLMLGAVNTDRFYDPDTRMWCEPLGDLLRPEAGDQAGREALPDMTAEEIEALPDGVEKDHQHEMQIVGEAVPQAETLEALFDAAKAIAHAEPIAIEAQQASSVRSVAPTIRRR